MCLALHATLFSRSAPLLAVLVASCGARTAPAEEPCITDQDCDDERVCTGVERCENERCVHDTRLLCDDEDPCTDDSCDDQVQGGCVFESVRVDKDGDGEDAVIADRPACGLDCDDADPAISTLAPELCNGHDDDCDRRVDEGAAYAPEDRENRLTFDEPASTTGSLVWNPESDSWGMTLAGFNDGSSDVAFLELSEDGDALYEPKVISLEPGDAFGGVLVWTEREYGVVWEDRRQGDFEIYFNRLTPDGEKLRADQRVTTALGWSINPDLAWTGSEFAIAWQDGRHQVESTENHEIYMTFLDDEGFEIGDDIRLTTDFANSESPHVAIGDEEIGVAFLDGRDGVSQIYFLATDMTGMKLAEEVRVSDATAVAIRPQIAWADGAFIVAWEEQPLDGDADLVAARIPRGPAGPVEGPFHIHFGPSWSRGPSLLSNGDRLVIAFSDDRDGQFAQYFALFDNRLGRLSDDIKITHGPSDSVYGGLSRGDTSIGLAYHDMRDGNWEVYFTRLLCAE